MTILIILGSLLLIAFFGGIPAMSRIADERAEKLWKEWKGERK